VTAFVRLRFATAHRFFAAREILLLPSAVKRRECPVSAFAGAFLEAVVDVWAFTVSLARTTAAFAESSNSTNPSLPPENWSITLDKSTSILFRRLIAFLAFIHTLPARLYYYRHSLRHSVSEGEQSCVLHCARLIRFARKLYAQT
jgi:hypothetical protein